MKEKEKNYETDKYLLRIGILKMETFPISGTILFSYLSRRNYATLLAGTLDLFYTV